MDYEKKLNRLKNWSLSPEEKANAKRFLEGEPVINLPPSDIRLPDNSTESRKAAKKETIARVRESGEQTIPTPEADIVFGASGVKKSLNHSINQGKIDAVPYIPEGIEKGMTIDVSDDLDGNPIKNIHRALPVKTDTDDDLLVIRAREREGQEANFYNHALFKLKELKKRSAPNDQPAVAYTSTNLGGQRTDNQGIAHIKNILHDILNVKENDDSTTS